MDEKTVIHNGVEVAEGWPQRIEEAQHQTTDLIGGKPYGRVRYGNEGDDWGADRQACHDCAVLRSNPRTPSFT